MGLAMAPPDVTVSEAISFNRAGNGASGEPSTWSFGRCAPSPDHVGKTPQLSRGTIQLRPYPALRRFFSTQMNLLVFILVKL